MAVRIAVGDESFDEIRKAGFYYVDKTELLYDLVERTNNKVTLFTRPRRFGKTLNVSMMESFFDINRNSKAVFEELDISKHQDFCSEWMNRYPVLSISFKDVEGLNFESAFVALQEAISDCCFKYSEIAENEKVDPSARGQTVALKIPNAEIAGIFEDAVVKLFIETIDNSRQRELMEAFWEEDIEGAAKQLSDFLWDTISYHDYHEDYYHAFMVGLFVGLGYSVDSNKESGLGRFDIRVKDRKNRRVMIIEAKKADSADKMDAACDEALKQVVDKGYARTIEPGYEKIITYGISFFRKTAMIKKM